MKAIIPLDCYTTYCDGRISQFQRSVLLPSKSSYPTTTPHGATSQYNHEFCRPHCENQKSRHKIFVVIELINILLISCFVFSVRNFMYSCSLYTNNGIELNKSMERSSSSSAKILNGSGNPLPCDDGKSIAMFTRASH